MPENSAGEPQPAAGSPAGTPADAVRAIAAGAGGGNSQNVLVMAGSGAAGARASGVSEVAGSGGVTAQAGAHAACKKGTTKGSEVVFIGESFIAAGTIPSKLSALARQAGTIGTSESYRSFAVSGTQLTTQEIPMQYEKARAESPVKAVLMDGGGNDLLWGGQCKDGPESCSKVLMVVQALFKQMHTDGVEDVVYFFYPDPMGIGASIKGAQDTLRPEMKKLCDGATDVRCVWVDQRESWEGHYDTYTSDGIHPTEAGSEASAKQIWAAMVANCVAQ